MTPSGVGHSDAFAGFTSSLLLGAMHGEHVHPLSGLAFPLADGLPRSSAAGPVRRPRATGQPENTGRERPPRAEARRVLASEQRFPAAIRRVLSARASVGPPNRAR